MVDCIHLSPPYFDKLSRDESIEVEKEMIALIRKHALFGTAVAFSEKDYNEVLPPPYNLTGTAYTYCCWTVLSIIHEWIVRNQFGGKIAYFFEAGHKHQLQANAVMNQIFLDRDRRATYRYAAHSFVEKQCARPIQAADILAWQHAADVKKILESKKRRADFAALIEGQPLMLRHIGRPAFEGMRSQIEALLKNQHHNLISGTFGGQSFVSIPRRNDLGEGPLK
jgi:hypothetical protein